VDLRLTGLRPSVRDLIRWRLGRRDGVRMVPIRLTPVLFAGYGTKRGDQLRRTVER
jgi:2-polyprenyl-6-hydroxyphenyl methylase/3-demethylubiquinone-9 3-methyltransferase